MVQSLYDDDERYEATISETKEVPHQERKGLGKSTQLSLLPPPEGSQMVDSGSNRLEPIFAVPLARKHDWFCIC